MNNVPYRYEKEFKGEIRINNKLHKSSSIIYVRFLHPSTEVCMKKFDYYANEKIVCAIDDSAKHSAEYAKHSVKTCSPCKSYNTELSHLENVTMYKNAKELISCIENISLL